MARAAKRVAKWAGLALLICILGGVAVRLSRQSPGTQETAPLVRLCSFTNEQYRGKLIRLVGTIYGDAKGMFFLDNECGPEGGGWGNLYLDSGTMKNKSNEARLRSLWDLKDHEAKAVDVEIKGYVEDTFKAIITPRYVIYPEEVVWKSEIRAVAPPNAL